MTAESFQHLFSTHPMIVAHHHNSLDVICQRLGALLKGLGIIDPCLDEEFDLGGVVDDALAMIIKQSRQGQETR